MSKKNTSKKNTKEKSAIVRLLGDKRFLSASVAVLSVAVIALTVLLILDHTGALYRTSDESGAVSSSAAEPIDGTLLTDGGYRYILLKDGTAELSFFIDSTATAVDVPSSIGGYPVSSIGEECFTLMVALKDVTVPEGVISIAPLAFEGCSQLRTLRLPSTLTTVADTAFLGCSELADVSYAGELSRLDIGVGNSALKKALSLRS